MARPHLGEGELALERSKSVFINCPFDGEYSALFEAIVFATVCCGFVPRSALESSLLLGSRTAQPLHKPNVHRLRRTNKFIAMHAAFVLQSFLNANRKLWSGNGRLSSGACDAELNTLALWRSRPHLPRGAYRLLFL